MFLNRLPPQQGWVTVRTACALVGKLNEGNKHREMINISQREVNDVGKISVYERVKGTSGNKREEKE